MATYQGYLFSKLGRVGTRSEGPDYFLQQLDGSEVPIVKQTEYLWQGDSTLQSLLAKKVRIEGRLDPQGIHYDLVLDWGSVAPTLPSSRPDIGLGDVGEYVLYLQNRLRELGYTVITDAIFGSVTKTKVEEFQVANGLVADGVVRNTTWAALEQG